MTYSRNNEIVFRNYEIIISSLLDRAIFTPVNAMSFHKKVLNSTLEFLYKP